MWMDGGGHLTTKSLPEATAFVGLMNESITRYLKFFYLELSATELGMKSIRALAPCLVHTLVYSRHRLAAPGQGVPYDILVTIPFLTFSAFGIGCNPILWHMTQSSSSPTIHVEFGVETCSDYQLI